MTGAVWSVTYTIALQLQLPPALVQVSVALVPPSRYGPGVCVHTVSSETDDPLLIDA